MNSNAGQCCTAMRPAGEAQNIGVRGGVKPGEVTFVPPMDLYELDDRYEVRMDLPGSSAEHIEVTVHDGVLTVQAVVPGRFDEGIRPLLREYGVGDFRRRVRLGQDIDQDRVSAEYTAGVLTLTLRKRAENAVRRVPITAG